MIKFGYTLLYVSDVVQSIEFYKNSFGFERIFITPERDYGELSTGGTTLGFVAIGLAKTNLYDGFIVSNLQDKPFGIEIGIVTDEIESTLEKARNAGAIIIESIKEKSWGQKVAYVRDPDGFLIEICTPMS